MKSIIKIITGLSLFLAMYTPAISQHAKVDQNIFAALSPTSTNFSSYDRLSIMHYFFPPELVTDGSMFTENATLSTTDMQFSKQAYPFPNYRRLPRKAHLAQG